MTHVTNTIARFNCRYGSLSPSPKWQLVNDRYAARSRESGAVGNPITPGRRGTFPVTVQIIRIPATL